MEKLFATLVNSFLNKSREQSSDKPEAHFEVERKFRLSKDEWLNLPSTLQAKRFVPAGQVTMTDTFLPVEKQGDMNRVRVESENGKTRNLLTIKSWVNAAGGKERLEKECSIDYFASRLLLIFGRLIKGKSLLSFTKERRMFSGVLNGFEAIVCLDLTEGLGSYSGHYLEIEIQVPNESSVASAREEIGRVAIELLGDAREPAISYMEMLKRVSGQ